MTSISPGSAAERPGLAGLSPAYFGLVMATGIVSLAALSTGPSNATAF